MKHDDTALWLLSNGASVSHADHEGTIQPKTRPPDFFAPDHYTFVTLNSRLESNEEYAETQAPPVPEEQLYVARIKPS